MAADLSTSHRLDALEANLTKLMEMLSMMTADAKPAKKSTLECVYRDCTSPTGRCQNGSDEVTVADPRILCKMHKCIFPIAVWKDVMAAVAPGPAPAEV
jgi:hypothetical protein